MIKAILFDLDGVLVDAVRLHEIAFLEAVKPYKEVSREYHARVLNGLPTKKKLEKLGFYNDIIEEINKKKQEITFSLIPNMIQPVPKVQEVIKEVKVRGIPFAICSNAIRESVELLLKAGGVEGHSFIISNQEVINPKPDPEMYLKAITRMGLDGSEILIVEDSPHGLEAAKRSGAKVCQISDPQDIGKVLECLDEYNNSSSR